MSLGLRNAGYKVIASDTHLRLAAPDSPVAPEDSSCIPRSWAHLWRTASSTLRPPADTRPFNGYAPRGSPTAVVPPRNNLSEDKAAHLDAMLAQLDRWRPELTMLENSLLRHDLVLAVNPGANLAETLVTSVQHVARPPCNAWSFVPVTSTTQQASIMWLCRVRGDTCTSDCRRRLLSRPSIYETPVRRHLSPTRDHWARR